MNYSSHYLMAKFVRSFLILVALFVFSGCQATSSHTQHTNDSLDDFVSELRVMLAVCEVYLAAGTVDSEFLKRNQFYMTESNKISDQIYSRKLAPKNVNVNNSGKSLPAIITFSSKKRKLRYCGLVKNNFNSVIRKMDKNFRRSLKQKGYKLKIKRPASDFPNEVYVQDGNSYYATTRNFKLNESVSTVVFQLVKLSHSEKAVNDIARVEKLLRYNKAQTDPKILQEKARAENARIANQQAVAQQQRIQQQQQVFINQSRVRNPPPPTGLN